MGLDVGRLQLWGSAGFKAAFSVSTGGGTHCNGKGGGGEHPFTKWRHKITENLERENPGGESVPKGAGSAGGLGIRARHFRKRFGKKRTSTQGGHQGEVGGNRFKSSMRESSESQSKS